MIKQYSEQLEQLKEKNLFRELKSVVNKGKTIIYNNRELINFSSNDYIGLAQNEHVKKRSIEFINKYGSSSTASRLVCGNMSIFEELETRLAKLKHCESALLFNAGYMANVGIISAISNENTFILADKLIHASIVDAIKMSQVKFRRFKHNDSVDLENLLKKYSKNFSKIIVVVESVYSMDGDLAPLQEMYDLSKKYNAIFYVDEAHSTAVFGKNGEGLSSQLKNRDDDLIVMSTCGKGLGNFGAFFAGSKTIKEYLINSSRAFIYATALPPAVIGGLNGALDILESENRGEEVLKKAEYFRNILKSEGINTLNSNSQIIPIVVGESAKALNLSNYLLDNGYFISAIRPPTVPQGTSRLRVAINFYHSKSDLENLAHKIVSYM